MGLSPSKFNHPGSFRSAGPYPADDKYIALNQIEREAYLTDGFSYDGMQVYQQDNDTLYILKGTTNNDWEIVGGGAYTPGNGINITNNIISLGGIINSNILTTLNIDSKYEIASQADTSNGTNSIISKFILDKFSPFGDFYFEETITDTGVNEAYKIGIFGGFPSLFYNDIQNSTSATVRMTENGLEYTTDISNRFNNRTLIDKGYTTLHNVVEQGNIWNPISGNFTLGELLASGILPVGEYRSYFNHTKNNISGGDSFILSYQHKISPVVGVRDYDLSFIQVIENEIGFYISKEELANSLNNYIRNSSIFKRDRVHFNIEDKTPTVTKNAQIWAGDGFVELTAKDTSLGISSNIFHIGNSGVKGGNTNNIIEGRWLFVWGDNNKSYADYGAAIFGELNEASLNASASFISGENNFTDAYGAMAQGRGVKVSGTYSWGGGWYNVATSSGKTNLKAPLVSGNGSFGFFTTDGNQIDSQGVLSLSSAVLGGLNPNIPADSPRSVILGGNAIKALVTTPDSVYVPNFYLGMGTGANMVKDNTLTQILTRASDGKIKYRDQNTLGRSISLDENNTTITVTRNNTGTFSTATLDSNLEWIVETAEGNYETAHNLYIKPLDITSLSEDFYLRWDLLKAGTIETKMFLYSFGTLALDESFAYGGIIGDGPAIWIGNITTPPNAAFAPTNALYLYSDGGILKYKKSDQSIVTLDGSSVVSNFNDLGDVTITTPSDNQGLIYSGGQWINSSNVAIKNINQTIGGQWTFSLPPLFSSGFNVENNQSIQLKAQNSTAYRAIRMSVDPATIEFGNSLLPVKIEGADVEVQNLTIRAKDLTPYDTIFKILSPTGVLKWRAALSSNTILFENSPNGTNYNTIFSLTPDYIDLERRLKLKSYDSTTRDGLTGVLEGSLIYNSSTLSVNAYLNGAWTALGSGGTISGAGNGEIQTNVASNFSSNASFKYSYPTLFLEATDHTPIIEIKNSTYGDVLSTGLKFIKTYGGAIGALQGYGWKNEYHLKSNVSGETSHNVCNHIVRWGSNYEEPQYVVEIITKTGVIYTPFVIDGANISFFEAGDPLFQGGTGVLLIKNAGVVPTGNPSLGGYMYSENGAGKWRGSSGTITTFGTADPHCPTCDSDYVHEWENEKYGYLAVCMNCLSKELGDVPYVTRKKGSWSTH